MGFDSIGDEMSTSKSADKISDVIQVMQSGVIFYQDAIKNLENDNLKATFANILRNKVASVESLQSLTFAQQHERKESASLLIDVKKIYTKFTEMFKSNIQHAYISHLE